MNIGAGKSKSIRLRFTTSYNEAPFKDFNDIFKTRIAEADEFYDEAQHVIKDEDKKNIQRQAFAGMLWSKQFFYYDVSRWLKGDPGQPPPPGTEERS